MLQLGTQHDVKPHNIMSYIVSWWHY